jgi:hypothetical protein
MEIVAILRALWRRRLLVVAGFVLSALVVIGAGKAPVTTSADAHTQILVDTHRSALIYPAPLGVETTPWRGQIETDLQLTAPEVERIANGAKVPVDQLSVYDPFLAAPLTAASLPRHASLSANGAVAGAPYQLALSMDPQFPIIHVEATAPDRSGAVRVATAAASIIERDSSSLENKDLQGLSFTPVDQMRVKVTRSGGSRLMAIAMGLLLLSVWMGAIALVQVALDHRRRPRRKISAFADVDLV